MKNKAILLLVALLLFSGCSNGSDEFSLDNTITVVSREDGSGTRGAFIELTGVLVEDGDNESDMTYEEAVIANKNDAILTTVAGDNYAIGYISLGSYNDSVKLVNINGVEPSEENIASGDYEIYRPFNIAVKDEDNELANDFIEFALSKEGQEVVANDYISADTEADSYESQELSGKLSIGGSTSVAPVVEKLKEAYIELNPDVTIDIQVTGSSAGMTGAIDETLDIGMASRELKDSELEELTSYVIAYDGIALIVNNENTIENLTLDQVREIYTGEITEWSSVSE